MRAAIYCRVSTKAQAEDGTSLETQQRACTEAAHERGYRTLPELIFREDWPGDSLDRPQLSRLRELVRTRSVEAVICYATDRLCRNPIHLFIFAEECEKANVPLVFVTEPLDASPEGQLIRFSQRVAIFIIE